MPRYIDADQLLTELSFCADNYRPINWVIQTIKGLALKPNPDIVEAEKITSAIARLRSDREANLIKYTSNEGKEIYVIRSQKDRGYFQALDDVEKLLLKLKEFEDIPMEYFENGGI